MCIKDDFRMTVEQLLNACHDNKYIIIRYSNLTIIGVNCKIGNYIMKQKRHKKTDLTRVIGYYPCDFQTYISHKAKFI